MEGATSGLSLDYISRRRFFIQPSGKQLNIFLRGFSIMENSKINISSGSENVGAPSNCSPENFIIGADAHILHMYIPICKLLKKYSLTRRRVSTQSDVPFN